MAKEKIEKRATQKTGAMADDHVLAWLQARTVFVAGINIPCKEVYADYCRWCAGWPGEPLDQTAFERVLSGLPGQHRDLQRPLYKKTAVWCWENLALRSAPAEESVHVARQPAEDADLSKFQTTGPLDSLELRQWCIERAMVWPMENHYAWTQADTSGMSKIIPPREADVIDRAERLLKWVTKR